jgi:hypothetical protein
MQLPLGAAHPRFGGAPCRTTTWIEDVENTATHQDVVLVAADPASRRVRLTDAWAGVGQHLDEGDDPDAFAIGFADITLEK